jgi:hypothetical protein
MVFPVAILLSAAVEFQQLQDEHAFGIPFENNTFSVLWIDVTFLLSLPLISELIFLLLFINRTPVFHGLRQRQRTQPQMFVSPGKLAKNGCGSASAGCYKSSVGKSERDQQQQISVSH